MIRDVKQLQEVIGRVVGGMRGMQRLLEGGGAPVKSGGKWKKYQRICGGEQAELHLLGHLIGWLKVLSQEETNNKVKSNLKNWMQDLKGYVEEPLEGWEKGNSRLKEIVSMMSAEDGQSKIRGGVVRQVHIVLSNILLFSPMFLRSEGKNWDEINAAIKKISNDRLAKGDDAVIYQSLGSRHAIVRREELAAADETQDDAETEKSDDKAAITQTSDGQLTSDQSELETKSDRLDSSATEVNDSNLEKAADDVIWMKDDDVHLVHRAITDRRPSRKAEILTQARPAYEAIIQNGVEGKYQDLSGDDKKELNRIIGTYYRLALGFGNQDLVKPNWFVKK